MVASLTRHELTGVVILKNGTILSGHRRVEAAKAAGIIECDCIVRTDLKNEWDELEALLDYNRQREKSNEQRAREYDAYLEVERQRARERQIETLKQNARNLDSRSEKFFGTGKRRIKTNCI